MKKYIKAHKKSINNKSDLKNSKKYGCFYCLTIFDLSEVTNWITDETDTAVCPYCNMDAVITESDEVKIDEKFLGEMYTYWFGTLR